MEQVNCMQSYHLEDDDKNLITANGSANSTEKGLWANWEQMTVHTNSDPLQQHKV